LSSGGLKAVKLVLADKDQGVRAEACEMIEHRKILSQAANEAEERDLVDESISALCARHELKGCRIALGLPGMMAICRHVPLPPMEAKKTSEVMQYEVRHHLPHESGDLVWGYHVMEPTSPSRRAPEERAALLVAVRREQLTRHLDKVRALKVDFDVIQCDALALHNLVVYERFANPEQGNGSPPDGRHAVGVLDIGTDSTSFIVSSPRHVWFRNIGVAGHSLTRALVRELNVTYAQAEKLKRDPTDAPSLGEMHRALEPVYKDLANEALASLGAHDTAHGKNRVQRFLAVGGSSGMHGLLRYLRSG